MLKGYFEGVGIMVLARITGGLNQLIIQWNSNYAKILGELITKATISQRLENVEILEMDELIHIRYVFVDRTRNKILVHCS